MSNEACMCHGRVFDCDVVIQAVEIADETALNDIECNLVPVGDGWYDTEGNDCELTQKSIRYLEASGQLERDPARPSVIRAKERA